MTEMWYERVWQEKHKSKRRKWQEGKWEYIDMNNPAVTSHNFMQKSVNMHKGTRGQWMMMIKAEPHYMKGGKKGRISRGDRKTNYGYHDMLSLFVPSNGRSDAPPPHRGAAQRLSPAPNNWGASGRRFLFLTGASTGFLLSKCGISLIHWWLTQIC